jgi:hypothetical protein
MFDDIFRTVFDCLKNTNMSDLSSEDESRAGETKVNLALDLTKALLLKNVSGNDDTRFFKALDGRIWKCFNKSVIRFYRNDAGHVIGTDETHIYGDAEALVSCSDVAEISKDVFNNSITVMKAIF